MRYHHLADKKENLLRIRVPDVEMMILDAEEACDRFRFSLALGMLGEAKQTTDENGRWVLHLTTCESPDDIRAICSFLLNPDDLTIVEEPAQTALPPGIPAAW